MNATAKKLAAQFNSTIQDTSMFRSQFNTFSYDDTVPYIVALRPLNSTLPVHFESDGNIKWKPVTKAQQYRRWEEADAAAKRYTKKIDGHEVMVYSLPRLLDSMIKNTEEMKAFILKAND